MVGKGGAFLDLGSRKNKDFFYQFTSISIQYSINIFIIHILIHLKLGFVLSKFRVQKLIGTEMESWTILI